MKNMGKTDRMIRMILGIIMLVAGVALQLSTGGFWWIAALGLVFIVTSSISFCPLYVPFRINTDKGSGE
jgi:hypothetical protein